MKKLLSLVFCLLLLASTCTVAFAENAADTNVAPLGTAYSSADYNEWAPKTAINNENYGDAWQAQHISRDPSVGTVGEYCGVRFITDYYLVSEIRVCVGTHSNEVTYGINVLIEGEWIEIAERKESDAETIDDRAWFIIKLDEPVVTNNVRVVGKNYVDWDLPYVREVEIFGHKTDAPEIIVPEGGVITRNAALEGLAYAASSADGHYPALINDNKIGASIWTAETNELPVYAGVKLADTRTVNRIKVATGSDNGTAYTATFNIEALVDGEWTVITEGTVNNENGYTFEYTLDEKVKTDNVRVVYTASTVNPQLAELEVWSDERNVFMENKMSGDRLTSAVKGNLAVYGTPYAETTLDLYASPDVINDGAISGKNANWVAYTSTVPTYCGVTLAQPAEVNKVVLYFEEQETAGDHVMYFDVQLLIGDEYVTVESDSSYNKTTGYVAIVEFEAQETKDVRIVFRKNGDIFPSLCELEVYATESEIAPYDGYVSDVAYGGLTKPEGYEEARVNPFEDLTYDTTTRDSLPAYIPSKDYTGDTTAENIVDLPAKDTSKDTSKDTTSGKTDDTTKDTGSDTTGDTTKGTTVEDSSGTGGDPGDDSQFPVVPVIIGAVAAIAIVGAVLFFLNKKKILK